MTSHRKITVGGVKGFVAADRLSASLIRFGYRFRAAVMNKNAEDVPQAVLHAHRFQSCPDDETIPLMARAVPEIHLAHLLQLLERQPNGEPGSLLVNGFGNHCRILGIEGITWSVDATWYDGWNLDVSLWSISSGWRVDLQVLYRSLLYP